MSARSATYRINNNGLRTKPCGTKYIHDVVDVTVNNVNDHAVAST